MMTALEKRLKTPYFFASPPETITHPMATMSSELCLVAVWFVEKNSTWISHKMYNDPSLAVSTCGDPTPGIL